MEAIYLGFILIVIIGYFIGFLIGKTTARNDINECELKHKKDIIKLVDEHTNNMIDFVLKITKPDNRNDLNWGDVQNNIDKLREKIKKERSNESK